MAFCTVCGANVPDDVRFCTECGAPMGTDSQGANPAGNAIPPVSDYVAAPPPQPQPRNIPPQAPYYSQPPVMAQQMPVYAPAYAQADAAPPKGSPYAVLSTGGYIWTMILFSIPFIGWLACIIMAFAAKNLNRRHFAKAMLVFLILGLIVSIALYFVANWVIGAVMEYVNEAVGGTMGEFGGMKDLLGIISQMKE